MTDSPYLIRLAGEADADFILGLAPRFAAFALPAWRRRAECVAGIRAELQRHLDEQAANSHLFVAEDADGGRAGFIHLQQTRDFFNGRHNCHIADLAVAAAHEGRGAARALLAHAEAWAGEHRCALLTLAVFPGNERARALYEAAGYGADLLRLAKPVGATRRVP
jgi:ribosomal protein S18 acetylase RimI-like enzyme